MQVGDLCRFVDTYDINNIGVGSIGIILQQKEKRGLFYVFINGGNYWLPFHHIQEIKCK